MAAAIIGVIPPASGIRRRVRWLLHRRAVRVCARGSSGVASEFCKYPPV